MGAPLGNQNAAKARKWSKAIERAAEAWPGKAVSLEVNRGLDAAAYEFVAKLMEEKDLGYFKEFGDRMEGKPAQTLIHNGDEDGGPVNVEARIRLVKPSEEGK